MRPSLFRRVAPLLILGATILGTPQVRAATPVAGPVELLAQVIIPAGSANGSASVKINYGFDLVIQSISFFRSNVVAGSIGQVFAQITVKDAIGYTALPEAVADGAIYPAATLTTTLNADHATYIVFNGYRSGSDAAQETDNIVVNGYYVAVPPKN